MSARHYLSILARLVTWMNLLALAALIALGGSAAINHMAGAPVTANMNNAATGNGSGQNVETVKIMVERTGLYEISAQELQSIGFNLNNPAALTLENRGQTVPFWVIKDANGSNSLQFYGRQACGRYAADNVYLLQAGGKQSQSQISLLQNEACSETGAQAPDADRTPVSTLHLGKNQLYLPLAAGTDHWFWQILPAPKSTTLSFDLAGLARGAARLRVELWSATSAMANPDHRVSLQINGQPVLDETWDGAGVHTLNATLPDGLLKITNNQMQIDLPSIPGVMANSIALNWIEIDYPRSLSADQDVLAFTSTGGLQRLSGFSGMPVVLDVSDEAHPLRIAIDEGDKSSDVAKFQSQAGHQYLVVGPRGILQAAGITTIESEPSLLESSIPADWVAIGPPDLLQVLQPLIDWRSAHGLKTLAVPIGVIYDQFNGGLPEPLAIQAFLQAAAKKWKAGPRFVLLVGDASYDPQGYITGDEANRLPSFMVETTFGGETASDAPFEEYDGNSKPLISVGRLPARTAEQVSAYVQKTLTYEKMTGKGISTIAAVADGQDISFHDEAQAFLNSFPQTDKRLLLSPEPGDTTAAVKVSGYFKQGIDLIAYFGHGSTGMWGKDKLFTTQDAQALAGQTNFPLVINMTCLTGYFIHPRQDTVTDALLWNPDGGAVGILAPTSLTMPTEQGKLSTAFANALVKGKWETIGEVLLEAQQSISQDLTGNQDVLKTFMLFGDPALSLH